MMKSHSSITLCLLVLASLCSFNTGLSTRRKAVNNVFDSLTEVHDVINKLEDSSSNDASDNTYNRDVSIDKDMAEKFVEEIDQLEDLILNKKNANDISESRRKTSKDENGKKSMQLPSKRVETSTSESIDSRESEDDEDIEESVNLLISVLKEGLQHEKRESKLNDYLISIFQKETRELKKRNAAISALINAREKKSKNEKQDEEVYTATTGKPNANFLKEEHNCGEGCAQKEEFKEKEVEVKPSAKSNVKSEPAKKREATSTKHDSRVVTQLIDNASAERVKKHAKEVKTHSSTGKGEFDNEIQDLVDVILKRREDLKREKLKLAVANMLQILEKKENGYKQRDDDVTSKEMRKYERILMES